MRWPNKRAAIVTTLRVAGRWHEHRGPNHWLLCRVGGVGEPETPPSAESAGRLRAVSAESRVVAKLRCVIDPEVTRRVVADFLQYVRSGRAPHRASEFMAPVVLAHQVQSENEVAIERSSDDYADHVREMTATWGQFDLLVDEFLVDGSRAFVRLTQVGRHIAPVNGHDASGRVGREISSLVYHVENGVITQYWIQIDRAGLTEQLARPSDG